MSNVEQEVVLQYLCPCQQDFRYYDNTRNYLFKSLRDYPGCKSYQNRLGFCNTRNKGKLLVECIKDTTLNVTVYVRTCNKCALLFHSFKKTFFECCKAVFFTWWIKTVCRQPFSNILGSRFKWLPGDFRTSFNSFSNSCAWLWFHSWLRIWKN